MRRRYVLALTCALSVLCSCASGQGGTTPTAVVSPSAPLPTSEGSAADGSAADKEQRDVRGFTAVELSGIGNATIDQSGTESLTIEAEPAVLPLLTSEVSGGTLRLGVKPNTSISTTRPINYRITVETLDGLSVSGTGNLSASHVTTDRLTVAIRGAGEITIDGTADRQDVQISGSGEYHAGGLTSKIANVSIAGSGDAEIAASQALTVTIRGSGGLTYHGNPAVTQRITGSGEVVKA